MGVVDDQRQISMQSGVRVAEGRRGGVKARQRLLRPKQQDRFGFRFYRVYFAFGSRYRTILACAKREDEPVCSGGRTKVRMSSKRLSARRVHCDGKGWRADLPGRDWHEFPLG